MWTHRENYAVIKVFDLNDDNTTGSLAILPYVEETNETCIQPTRPTPTQPIPTKPVPPPPSKVLICVSVSGFLFLSISNYDLLIAGTDTSDDRFQVLLSLGKFTIGFFTSCFYHSVSFITR